MKSKKIHMESFSSFSFFNGFFLLPFKIDKSQSYLQNKLFSLKSLRLDSSRKKMGRGYKIYKFESL